jgi:hypothetical protein
MSFDHEPADGGHVQARRAKRWPAFLAGLLLGAGVAVGALLALWNPPALRNAFGGGGHGHADAVEVSHRPTDEEVLDFLDGKTLNLPTKDVNIKPKTVTIKKGGVTDLKWDSAARIGGSDEPWDHRYSCLYVDESGSYIFDLRIPVRVVGRRRVFLPMESSKVTPVEKIVTPQRD